jgi:hypothetical protein
MSSLTTTFSGEGGLASSDIQSDAYQKGWDAGWDSYIAECLCVSDNWTT